jgi:thioredoxin reductase (NADPH)
MSKNYEVAVIGGGGAGTMAFLRCVLNNDNSVMFLGDSLAKKRGRAAWVAEVDNIPGMHDLKRPILTTTDSTIKWLETQEPLRDKAKVIKSTVTRIEKLEDSYKLYFTHNKQEDFLFARFIIIATGVMDVQPVINGHIKPIFPFANKSDVLYCVRCDGHRTIGHKLSIIGFNDSAIGIGAMMYERYGVGEISILTHGNPDQFSEKFITLARAYNMKFYREPITGILGDPKKEGLQGYVFSNGDQVETTRTIISLGVIVYNDLLKQLGADLDPVGKAIVNQTFETSVPGLFAVGDIVAGKKMQIYTAWDEAVDAADEINRRIRTEKRNLAVMAVQPV